jgi:hypothetical protein
VTVRANTPPAVNVVAGWLGQRVPTIPKQRNRTRAGYRKTGPKRPRSVVRRERAS